MQRTGSNIEEGIELFKLFLNQGDSIMTNSTTNKRKKRNYASTMTNVNENNTPQNNIILEKPGSQMNLTTNNQFKHQNDKDDNKINKGVLPKNNEKDNEKPKNLENNSTQVNEVQKEHKEFQQNFGEGSRVFEEEPKNYCSVSKNNDAQLPETESYSQFIDTNNALKENNGNYQSYQPQEKDPLMEKILDKTINDLSKFTSKDQLKRYLENLITSPSSEKEIESKKQQFLTLHNNNKTLRMGIEVLFKKYDEIKKKNEKRKQKIEEMSSSIGNLHGVLTNETIKKEKLLAQLNEYNQQNISNVLQSNEGY